MYIVYSLVLMQTTSEKLTFMRSNCFCSTTSHSSLVARGSSRGKASNMRHTALARTCELATCTTHTNTASSHTHTSLKAEQLAQQSIGKLCANFSLVVYTPVKNEIF